MSDSTPNTPEVPRSPAEETDSQKLDKLVSYLGEAMGSIARLHNEMRTLNDNMHYLDQRVNQIEGKETYTLTSPAGRMYPPLRPPPLLTPKNPFSSKVDLTPSALPKALDLSAAAVSAARFANAPPTEVPKDASVTPKEVPATTTDPKPDISDNNNNSNTKKTASDDPVRDQIVQQQNLSLLGQMRLLSNVLASDPTSTALISLQPTREYKGTRLGMPMKIDNVLQAHDDIYTHYLQHKQLIEWKTVLTKEAKVHITTIREKYQNANYTVPYYDFFVSNADKFDDILYAVRSTNREDFKRDLKEFAPSSYLKTTQPKLETFRVELGPAIVAHINQFMERFEIMMVYSKEFAPPLFKPKNVVGKHHEETLSSILLDSIPHTLGHELHNLAYPIEHKLPKSMEEYVAGLKASVDKLMTITDSSIPVHKALKRVAAVKMGKSDKPYMKKSVSNIEIDEKTYEPTSDSDQDLNALQTHADNKSNGCFRQAKTGDCPKGASCEYSHEPAKLNEALEFMINHAKQRLSDLTNRKTKASFSKPSTSVPTSKVSFQSKPSVHALTETKQIERTILRRPDAAESSDLDTDIDEDMVEDSS